MAEFLAGLAPGGGVGVGIVARASASRNAPDAGFPASQEELMPAWGCGGDEENTGSALVGHGCWMR